MFCNDSGGSGGGGGREGEGGGRMEERRGVRPSSDARVRSVRTERRREVHTNFAHVYEADDGCLTPNAIFYQPEMEHALTGGPADLCRRGLHCVGHLQHSCIHTFTADGRRGLER